MEFTVDGSYLMLILVSLKPMSNPDADMEMQGANSYGLELIQFDLLYFQIHSDVHTHTHTGQK